MHKFKIHFTMQMKILNKWSFFQAGFKHDYFISRTVLVKDGDVQGACRIVNRLMGKEGLLDQWRKTRYFERPTHRKRRVNFEKAKDIYNEDMARRIEFTLKKNRVDPYPGCS